MKVVIIGSALSGNKGAASMLEASIQLIEEKFGKSQFTLLSVYPSKDTEQNRYKNLRILNGKPLYLALVINPISLLHRLIPFSRPLLERLSKEVKSVAEADVFLDQGGITFSDGREKFLPYNIASITPAIFLRTPIIKCAQALGPFSNILNRLSAKLILRRVGLIVARGKRTLKNLKALKYLNNYTLGADLAFALNISKRAEREAKQIAKDKGIKNSPKNMLVGIGPSQVVKK
jgi:colanic acid/amylovoran biosynthesis protein